MAACYVVMSEGTSPIAFNIPSPVAVFDNRKKAEAYAEMKNNRSTRNNYYVRRADKDPN